MTKIITFVPANIGINGENQDGRSAFLIRSFNGGSTNALYAVNGDALSTKSGVYVGTNLPSENKGINYFLEETEFPRPGTLFLRTILDDFSRLDQLDAYAVFDGKKIGYWSKIANGEHRMEATELPKSKYSRFFEVVKVK